MQLIAYIIIYPILWFISILPFKVIYLISDGISFLLYRILGYRKKVVKSNLRLVFPEKSEAEINRISRKFYTHLCDLFLEMIKSLSISKSELEKRFTIKNPEAFRKIEQNGSGVLMYGHYASYEWSTVLQSHTKLPGLGIYKRIANRYFDKLVRRIRSKYNTELVHTKNALHRIHETTAEKDYRMIAFLSDQSPKYNSTSVWLDFMGINVPCFIGAEATAKKYNFVVGFLRVKKIKRGFYESEIVVISDDPRNETKYKITNTFNSLLEDLIKEAPEYYLWTHKRWKHKDKVPKVEQ